LQDAIQDGFEEFAVPTFIGFFRRMKSTTERGHPVRQRAKLALIVGETFWDRAIRAARSGGQDVRAPSRRAIDFIAPEVGTLNACLILKGTLRRICDGLVFQSEH
jgi:hypothetical protein